jgi:hypothetical protein
MPLEKEISTFDLRGPEFKAATVDVRTFMSAISGKAPGIVRPPGVLLTGKNIYDIRKYVFHAHSLPVDDAKLLVLLGEGESERGLEIGDFKNTFQILHDHADQWAPLENDIAGVGTELDIFAGKMALYADAIAEVIGEIKAGNSELADTPKTYGDLVKAYERLDEEAKLNFALDDEGARSKNDVVTYIEKIFKSVTELSDKSDSIHKRLGCFILEMKKTVIPELAAKADALRGSRMTEDVKLLRAKVETDRLEHARLSKEYRDKVRESVNAVAQSLSSGASTPLGLGVTLVGGLAMSIYVGVEAEHIRAERNALKEQVDEQNDRLTQLDQKQGKMQALLCKMEEMKSFAVEAEAGLINMKYLWNSIRLQAASSADSVRSTEDSYSLLLLASHVTEVALPWKKIKVDTDFLLQVFREAEEIQINKQGEWI